MIRSCIFIGPSPVPCSGLWPSDPLLTVEVFVSELSLEDQVIHLPIDIQEPRFGLVYLQKPLS